MVLNNAELKRIISGCIDVKTVGGDRAEFARFTDKQIEVYKKQNYIGQPLCNAGMCFDFYYDGSHISFEFNPVYKTSRSFLSFDVYDGDIMVHTFFTYNNGQGQTRFEYNFPTRERRRVRIYLPYSCGIELRGFTLDDGSTYEPYPTEGRKKLLLVGDSITHGYDSYYTSTSYATTVARHFDAVALNHGVGGYFFNADSIDEELPFEPDAITVAYGTNDWGRHRGNEETYRAEAKKFIDKLCETYPKAHIFGITPIWRASKDKRPELMPFDKIYDILGEYYGAHSNVTIVDGRVAVPNTGEFFSDGLHPNTIGQSIYGMNVISAMEKAGFHK